MSYQHHIETTNSSNNINIIEATTSPEWHKSGNRDEISPWAGFVYGMYATATTSNDQR